MDSNQNQQKNLIDTTDCLEAVGVFRCWKNFLFIITVCLLILLQASFWLINTGYLKADTDSKAEQPAAALEEPQQTKEAVNKPAAQTEKIQQAAKQAASDLNQPPTVPASLAGEQAKLKKLLPYLNIKIGHLTWLIRVADWLLILTSALYCLTLLFTLKISLLGRLGGINHISRAFFLALVFTLLLLPWQKFFGGIIVGAMFTPDELLNAYAAAGTRDIIGTVFYYLRFTGYWLIAFLVLIAAQLRSIRWAKTILRRLEVI
jgi:cell division protein FtsB